ncbi:MAG: TonB family protein [Luteitalea sp.]|nr:TonB family protein [Luteitalea sp.]
MTALRRNVVWIGGLAAVFLLPHVVRAQEPLERAQALYASAQFADALAVLTSIRPATRGETVAAAKTRALCLLALDRTAEAEGAFETLVEADPSVRLTEADAAPRVRALFGKVRQRVLPSLVHERFAAAKGLFTDGKRADAAVAFRELRPLLDDPDLAKAAMPGVSDLRVLVDGFVALTAADADPASSSPKPTTPEVASADAPDPATNGEKATTPDTAPIAELPKADAPATGAAATDSPVTAEDPGLRRASPPAIVPPVVVTQEVPRPRGITLTRQSAKLVLEVLINEQGRVDRATLKEPLHPIYDQMVLAAVEHWQYRPATRDGQPVKFLKTIEVTVHP